jgi:ubiquinol-cytochrome c reductase iron-sulfur subunit
LSDATHAAGLGDQQPTRRDFIHIAAGAATVAGGLLALWPFIDQMNPAADTLALSTTEVDISQIPVGSQITVSWRGKPVFIRHRTEEEIEAARAVDISTLRDPQTDDQRLVPDAEGELRPEILVMEGVCTHFGCVPLGNGAGDYDGWFCPCHGSAYDTAGRIRQGPAPLNLLIPPYAYLSDTTIRIG